MVRANGDGSVLRLKDVARVELGSKDYEFMGRVNGKTATLVGIFLQPNANALATAERVNADDDAARAGVSAGTRAQRGVRHDALRRRSRSARW